jgi:uncharacterized protein
MGELIHKLPRITVTLMLTHQCNLNCVYCYEKKKRSDQIMSVLTIKDIIRTSFGKYKDKFNEIVFDFMGGEPLLEYETIREVAEWVWSNQWSMPYLFYATTNGTLVHGEIKEWFSKYKDRIVLGLSYDGDSVSQDSNRSNSSAKVDFHFFAETWHFQKFKMTISPESLCSLYNAISYLHSHGVDGMFANLAYGVEWNQQHLIIFREQLRLLVEYYLKNPEVKPVSLLSMNLTAIFAENHNNKYCGAGTGMVFHDYNGKEYPCHLLSPINLDGTYLKEIQKTDYCDGEAFSPSECKRCLLQNICPSCCGMNYLYLGSFKQRFPFMCQIIKVQIAQNMIYQYHTIIKKQEYSENDLIIIKAIKKLKKLKLLDND